MDSKDDLVISAIRGSYKWSDLEPFVISLHRSGFQGSRVMLTNGITEELTAKFLEYGWTLVSYDSTPECRKGGNYCFERFYPLNDFLVNNPSRFRYIIHTDWRDVVFQSDPSIWLEKNLGSSKIIGCGEGMKIEEEYYNDWWVKQAAHPHTELYERVRKHEICCAGTLAGEAWDVSYILRDTFDVLSTAPDAPNYAGGVTPLIDQGVLNTLLHEPPFDKITRVPSWDEGFVATVNWYIVHRWADRPFPVLRDGMLFPHGKSEPYAIVHQYDRDPVWNEAIKSRYKEHEAAPENTRKWLGRK